MLCAFIAACGGAQTPEPTSELAEARRSYARVESGPAAQYFPEQLKSTKVALDNAESAFAAEGNTGKSRDLAILASRRATELDAQAHAAEAESLKRGNAVQAQTQSKEASLEQMTNAYAAFANQGRQFTPALIYQINDKFI